MDCKVNQCFVVFTYDDNTKSYEVMSLEEAMERRQYCQDGASKAKRVEIYLKVSEANTNAPLNPGVEPSTAPKNSKLIIHP